MSKALLGLCLKKKKKRLLCIIKLKLNSRQHVYTIVCSLKFFFSLMFEIQPYFFIAADYCQYCQ